MPQIVEHGGPHDTGPIDLVPATQDVDSAEAFLFQRSQTALASHHADAGSRGPEIPIRIRGSASDADAPGHVEDDGDYTVFASQRHELTPCQRLHVGRVDDREVSAGEALAGDKVQDFERGRGRRLVGFIVGD